MRVINLLALAGSLSFAAADQGFNYGAVQRDGTIKYQTDFQAEFSTAKKLTGTNGAFSSARLYTTIQAGTQNTPISAIPAAVAEGTKLLLGMWASSGQSTIDNEIAALLAAIKTYGTSFTNLVSGLSIGSEDLYRLTPTSFANDPNSVGASPDTLVSYIKQVRTALAGTSLSGVPIGHVDTWTGWVNGSNIAVAQACDWIGMNTFPYFQTTDANSIENAASLFNAALGATQGSSAGKPVWITETGWPVGGKLSGAATASTTNAKAYWDAVGCKLFGVTNVYWYTLVDANTDPTQPQFGIVGTSLSSTPLFDLTCSAVSSSSSKPAASSTAASSTPASSSAGTSPSASAIVSVSSTGSPTGPSSTGPSSTGSSTASPSTSVTNSGSTKASTSTGGSSSTTGSPSASTLVSSVSSSSGSNSATTTKTSSSSGTATAAATSSTSSAAAGSMPTGSFGAIGAVVAILAML